MTNLDIKVKKRAMTGLFLIRCQGEELFGDVAPSNRGRGQGAGDKVLPALPENLGARRGWGHLFLLATNPSLGEGLNQPSYPPITH